MKDCIKDIIKVTKLHIRFLSTVVSPNVGYDLLINPVLSESHFKLKYFSKVLQKVWDHNF